MIKLENVCKQYGSLLLFKDLNIEFLEGKKILIRGINGCGKSVLLKMIVGYTAANSGRIIVDNIELGKDSDFIHDAGVSINAPEFCNNMTGMENLLYLSKIKKIAAKEDILNLAKLLDFDKDIQKKYKTYSLGMRQKMRIIQALMDKPKYLILDEPFDALDKKSQQQVISLLNCFICKDTLLIFTSHNMEYEKFADEIYEIDDYNLIQIK